MSEDLGLNDTRVKSLLQEIMTVDVGGGCRDGRLSFIRHALGRAWSDWAESVGLKYEIVVLFIEHNTDDSYNLVPAAGSTWEEIMAEYDSEFSGSIQTHLYSPDDREVAKAKFDQACVALAE